jgi:hypothetical protein
MIEIHDAAAKAINEKGTALVAAIAPQVVQERPPGFANDRPIAAALTDADIIGEPTFGMADISGRMVSRFFSHQGAIVGLAEEGYEKLRAIAQQVLKTPDIRNAVSDTFVEEKIFEWVRGTYSGVVHVELSNILIDEIRAAVKPLNIWVPVAELMIEIGFEFGPVKFLSITSALLDRLDKNLSAKITEESREPIAQYIAKRRRKIQGRAAVVVEVEAEQGHGYDYALEMADVAVGLLRFLSAPALTPWIHCQIAIMGAEYIPQAQALIFEGEQMVSARSGMRGARGEGLQLPRSACENACNVVPLRGGFRVEV